MLNANKIACQNRKKNADAIVTQATRANNDGNAAERTTKSKQSTKQAGKQKDTGEGVNAVAQTSLKV